MPILGQCRSKQGSIHADRSKQGSLHGGSQIFFVTDVRSILMGLLAFQRYELMHSFLAAAGLGWLIHADVRTFQ